MRPFNATETNILLIVLRKYVKAFNGILIFRPEGTTLYRDHVGVDNITEIVDLLCPENGWDERTSMFGLFPSLVAAVNRCGGTVVILPNEVYITHPVIGVASGAGRVARELFPEIVL